MVDTRIREFVVAVGTAGLVAFAMADFEVAAPETAFPSESIGYVRWRFLDHGVILLRMW
jgi:hypothetical protein